MDSPLLDILQSGFVDFLKYQFETGITSGKSFGLCHPVHSEKTVIISLSALIVDIFVLKTHVVYRYM